MQGKYKGFVVIDTEESSQGLVICFKQTWKECNDHINEALHYGDESAALWVIRGCVVDPEPVPAEFRT